VCISALLQTRVNFRIFVKQRGEMCLLPHCCKHQRRCVNFRIFVKERGGDVCISALLQTPEEMC
jgi:hypothetical protein